MLEHRSPSLHTFQSPSKCPEMTNISFVTCTHFYKNRKLPHIWNMKPQRHCGAGENTKRHLKVTDQTEGKRKLTNSNANCLKINSEADIFHNLTHFAISLYMNQVIRNRIIKTQPVLLVNVTFYTHHSQWKVRSGSSIQKWLDQLCTSTSKIQCNSLFSKSI